MIEDFQDPHPDEILYSVWARFSERVRYHNKQHVFRELFGNRHAAAVVDLPCYLGYFVDHLPFGHDYTVDYFINCHTLFPFYSPFLSPEQRSRVREQMIAGNARSIYHRVGYKTGRSSTLDTESHFWLRFCPQCAEHDREVYGECYWHRLHQAQGVEICPVHKTFLENSGIRARGHVLSAEFVSAERAVGSVAPRLALSSPYFSILQDICTAIQFLLEHPDLALSREVSLSKQYRILLAHQGLVTVNGHVRRADFVNEFKNTFSPVLLSLLRCEITQPEYLKKTWPYRITRSSQGAQHPLHHILFLRFLGLTVEQFFSQDLKPYQPFGEGPWPCLNPVCTYYQQKHISTCQIHEQNGKGLIVGQFSCECGFTYCRSGPDRMDEDVHRRSKILSYGAAWETKLRELWFNPTVTLREAAHLLGISLSAVQRQAKRLQLPTPRIALRAARPLRNPQRIRTKKDIAWYRTQWLTLVQENPDVSKRALRKKAPGIYDWLDRQDQEWFIAHCPPTQKKRQLKKPPVNALRLSGDALRKEYSKDHDRQLADAVRKAARKITDLPGAPVKVTRHRIQREIPQIGINRRWENYPLTSQALEEVTENSEDFALRRIWWLVQQCKEQGICLKRWEFCAKLHLRKISNLPSIKQALDSATTMLLL